MTLETLMFLRQHVAGLTLHVGAPDFRDAYATVVRALDELDAAIAAATTPAEGATLPGTH